MSSALQAQNWVKVFTSPSTVSSGFFFNEDAGVIGTGIYGSSGTPAHLYVTSDGGKTWTRALLPNMNLDGQFCDIWFKDRFTGYAVLKQYVERGWSGIYKTVDGGFSWQLIYQADFAVTIRETKNGIFYTDRLSGVKRSIDGGQTFQLVAPNVGALGLDFLDDLVGYVSGESVTSAPHYITVNGGATWTQIINDHEAWTTYADPVSRKIFYASEHDNQPKGTYGYIVATGDLGNSFVTQERLKPNAITGGIAGPKGCASVVYVQGTALDTSLGVIGLLRTTDGGNTWINVGGPSNYLDTRFAVTGRGAVVYAFDKTGGVWKTTNGGDGTLTSSVIPMLGLQWLGADTLTASICDSATTAIRFTYSDCDSLIITNVSFLDDNAGELRRTSTQKYFGKSGSRSDTLRVTFKPSSVGSQVQRIRIRLRKSDGAFEDTILIIRTTTFPAIENISFIEGGASKTLNFGEQSICGGDSVRAISIRNDGCAVMRIGSLSILGKGFTLLSNFSPFDLEPGQKRQFLIRFSPDQTINYVGYLKLVSSNLTDSLQLTGVGIEGGRGLQMSQPLIETTTCDSTDVEIVIRNRSCARLLLDSLRILPPYQMLSSPSGIGVGVDSFVTIRVRLASPLSGNYVRELQVYSSIGGTRFDTILFVQGIVRPGAAELEIRDSIIDLGNVSICGFAERTIYVNNIGCSDVSIDSTSFVSADSGFTLLKKIMGKNFAKGNGDSIIIRFKPNVPADYSARIRLRTTIGFREIVITAAGTIDPGEITASITPVGSILLCDDTTFLVRYANTTCDSLIIDSVVIEGVARSDYSLASQGFTGLGSGSSQDLNGVFKPSTGGNRPAEVVCYLHTNTGTISIIRLPLDGTSIAPDPLVVEIAPMNYQVRGGTAFDLPVIVSQIPTEPVTSIQLQFECNTDLIMPENASLMYPGIAAIENVTAAGFVLSAIFTSPQLPVVGDLASIRFSSYVTDTLAGSIRLVSVTTADQSGSAGCAPALLGVNEASIMIDTYCGDSLLSLFLAKKLSLVNITKVTPNPTSGGIEVFLDRGISEAAVSTLYVYDEAGRKLQEQEIFFNKGEIHKQVRIGLDGASGVRFVRIDHSPMTAKVRLMK